MGRHAPTRPPNHRSERRPPRGPRPVPLTPREQQWKARIEAARDKLTELGEKDLAEAVNYTLTRSGAALLTKIEREKMDARGVVGYNVALYMREHERDHLQRASKARQETDEDFTLSKLAETGVRLYLTGKFTPNRPERAKPGSGAGVNLNVRVDKSLKTDADKLGKSQAAELGWTPTTAIVIKQYLFAQLPMPQ